MAEIPPSLIDMWQHRWTAFRHDHAGWLARHEQPGRVLYRLPQAIRDSLSQPLLHGRVLLQPTDVAAEQDFDSFCVGFHAEGMDQNRPVSYPLLQPLPMRLSATVFKKCGLPCNAGGLIEGTNAADELRLRSKGYIGRLVTDRLFVRGRDELRTAWLALPDAERPAFPLSRTIVSVRRSSQAVADFLTRLVDFCDRYGLLRLVSWELPDPVGPLLPASGLPPHILGARGVVIGLPTHFAPANQEELPKRIASAQQDRIRRTGLDPTCLTPRAAETYAHLFEIEHYTQVVEGRYGTPPRPKGFVGRVDEALMGHLSIGQEHLRCLRKSLRAFHRGVPHTSKGPR
jgi:hypothetical protein